MDTLTRCRTPPFLWTPCVQVSRWFRAFGCTVQRSGRSPIQFLAPSSSLAGMANPMTPMNSYYPGGAVAAYNSLSAASMAAAAAAATAQQSAMAGLATSNNQQVTTRFLRFLFLRRNLYLRPLLYYVLKVFHVP